jgi:acetyl esterase/lipase
MLVLIGVHGSFTSITAEILEGDSRGVAKTAQEAGVDVTFGAGLHMVHVYQIFFSYFPEARNELDNINKWIQRIFENVNY